MVAKGENSIAEPEIVETARSRWGHSLSSGFQIVPDVLFRSQKFLGLKNIDVVILLNLTLHWWTSDDLPHPTPAAIANRINVETRTVERRIVELQRRGFIERLESRIKKGRRVRPYDLSGLVEKLKVMSEHNLKLRRSNRPPDMQVSTD